MKNLHLSTPAAGHGLVAAENVVLKACRDAAEAQYDCAVKCLIAGHLLMEHRAALEITSHDGKGYGWNDRTKPKESKFSVWLESNEIPRSTAYRWMEAAERVGRARLGIAMSRPFSNFIEIDGAAPMPLSHCLTAPESSLPAAARKFRQDVFDFMADRTLGEAARAVVDGESDAKRITLAAGGKGKGGTRGEDRKAFDEFTKTKLKHLTTFLGHKLNVNQKAQIVAAFDAALEAWPRWVIEGLAEKCRTELKLAEPDRAARGKF